MKVFAVALSTLLASSNVNQVTSSKSEIVNTCKLVDKKQPTGPYAPYTGETKAAHAHLMFRDMDQKVLDVLKSFNNTKATFVIHSDKITDETLPLLQNIVADGHTIASNGQSSNPQINFLYANETLIEQQITGADEDFKKAIGYAPNLYMPSFGALDTRAHQILDAHDKQTILWSAGSNGWWFIGNNEPLETTVAALRYTMPEMGGMIMMPPDSAVLEEYLTQVWPYWDFVDFETCTGVSGKSGSSAKAAKTFTTKAAKATSETSSKVGKSKGSKAADAKAEKTSS